MAPFLWCTSIIFQVCVAIHEHHRWHFNSHHFIWNNHNEWKWNSSHDNSINETIACSKQIPSLCIHSQFSTHKVAETESLISLKLSYKHHEQSNIVLDFWNDLDWSQVDILHETTAHPMATNVVNAQNKRKLLNEGIFGNIVRALGNKVGIYARPPCDESSSQCRVHLYNRVNFVNRANSKGYFCEGNWDRDELLKYRVNRRSISSVQVQGSPCCVMIAYNGNFFDGDMQAMFPRGAYQSMTMGVDTSMGMGHRAATVYGMAMGGAASRYRPGFRNKEMSSMRIVHDCALTQRLMRGGGAMYGNNMMQMGGAMMNNDYMPNMEELLGTMMMMKMMFPSNHHHAHSHCKYYQCIVNTQQKQLQYLMQMMHADDTYNHETAPITISDRRRMIAQDRDYYGSGIKKCKLLYDIEICLVFDSIQNVIELIYTVKHEKDIENSNNDEAILGLLRNDEIQPHLAVFVYGIMRKKILFAAADDLRDDMNVTTYFDTFILDSSNKNDWDINQCNDEALAFISYAICVDNVGVIYFDKRMENESDSDDELSDIKLDISNDSDWSEIYHQKNRKMCNYISIIKICVELLHADATNFKILIEY